MESLSVSSVFLVNSLNNYLDLVKQIDLSTNWFFNYSLPIGISCFICMGILPVLFNYTFLSRERPSHVPLEELNDPEITADEELGSPKGIKRGLTSLREVASDEESGP